MLVEQAAQGVFNRSVGTSTFERDTMQRGTRREFLRHSGWLAANIYLATAARPARLWAADAANEVIPGKHMGLIVHTAQPQEIETPLALLREHRLTPKELLFVRNNQTFTGSLT